uniref:Uncharacterized protein n=1 Tax=Xiphophorus maculatus TaxID=8083 RepID=A0A3B5QQ02_XIPMA
IPRFIEDLGITKIIDISCGDSHCLALSHVYAWGNNTMGQCGQGHTSTPITKPRKVLGLEGISIQQITAGTSHSLAWTATLKRSTKLLKKSSHDKQIIKKLHSKNNSNTKFVVEAYSIWC